MITQLPGRCYQLRTRLGVALTALNLAAGLAALSFTRAAQLRADRVHDPHRIQQPDHHSGHESRADRGMKSATATISDCNPRDCARAVDDGVEFARRLSVSGFISSKAIHFCDEILTIITQSEGRAFTVAEVWPFLRLLHVNERNRDLSTVMTSPSQRKLLTSIAGNTCKCLRHQNSCFNVF